MSNILKYDYQLTEQYQLDKEKIAQLQAANSALVEALKDSHKWLTEAAQDIASWGCYAGSYFEEKHDLQGNIKNIEAAANRAESALKQAGEGL